MKTKLILTAIAILAITTWTIAQNNGNGNMSQKGTGKCAHFVDNNKDGKCDNYENLTDSTTSKNGRCNGKGHGQGKGKCKNNVDANNNGVCDKSEAQTKK